MNRNLDRREFVKLAGAAGVVSKKSIRVSGSRKGNAMDSQALRRLLTQVGDVRAIPTGHCTKSVSFGTTTQITYEGKTSGDLQCVRRPTPGDDQARFQAALDLARFVEEALNQLKVNPRKQNR